MDIGEEMTTIDTILKLEKAYQEVEKIQSDLDSIQDGLVEALRTYTEAMQQLIKENRE